MSLQDQAKEATKQQIVEEVAVVLKENWEMIRLGFEDKALPDFARKIKKAENTNAINNQFRKMANELIEKRQFTIKNTNSTDTTITISELNSKLQGEDIGKKFLAQKQVDSLDQLIPTTTQVEQIAAAVGEVAHNNSGFLRNIFRSSLSIAQNVENQVEEKLKTLEIPFLTKGKGGNIDRAGNAAYDAAYIAAGGKKEDIARTDCVNVTLENTEINTLDDVKKARLGDVIFEQTYAASQQGIRAKIEEEYTKNGFFGSIAKSIGPEWANFFIGIINAIIGMFNYQPYALIPTEQQINATSEIVAGTVKDVLTGEEASAIKDADSANKKVTAAVSGALSAKKQALSLTDEQIKEISTKAGKGAEDNFDEIKSVLSNNGNIVSAASKFAVNNTNDISYNPELQSEYQGIATNGYGKKKNPGIDISRVG